MARHEFTVNARWADKITIEQRKIVRYEVELGRSPRPIYRWVTIKICTSSTYHCSVRTKDSGWRWSSSPARIRITLEAGRRRLGAVGVYDLSQSFQTNVGSSQSRTYYLHPDGTISSEAFVPEVPRDTRTGQKTITTTDIEQRTLTCQATARNAGMVDHLGWYWSVPLNQCSAPKSVETPTTNGKSSGNGGNGAKDCPPNTTWSAIAGDCIHNSSQCTPGQFWSLATNSCEGRTVNDPITADDEFLDSKEEGTDIIVDATDSARGLLDAYEASPLSDYAAPVAGVAVGAVAATMLDRRALAGGAVGGALGAAYLWWRNQGSAI